MLNEILKLEGAQEITQNEQKEVNGGVISKVWGPRALEVVLHQASILFWSKFNGTNRARFFKMVAANVAVINLWGLGILRILQQRGMVPRK
jgi:hypothetical protein